MQNTIDFHSLSPSHKPPIHYPTTMMHSMLFTALLTGLVYPTAATAGTVDSNGIRVGSNTVTCRVDAGSGGGNGTNTATSYTWAFFWKYITNEADPAPTNGGLAWTLPAFSDTKHLVNCSVTSSRNASAQFGSDEYLVTGGVPSATHKILGMPVGDGEFGFGSLKSGNRSSGFTVSLAVSRLVHTLRLWPPSLTTEMLVLA